MYSTVCFYRSFGSKRKVSLFFGASAMPVKCDSLQEHIHTHADGGLCDLCQTYNRCICVRVLDITKLDTSSSVFYSLFFMTKSKRKRCRRRRCRKTNKQKNKAKHKVSSSKFTHFPRICFVRSAYYSHKFRQLQMAQPLNRIYFTKNHEIWCIRSKHNISLIYPTSGWFYRRLTLLTLWFCTFGVFDMNLRHWKHQQEYDWTSKVGRVLRIYSFARMHVGFPFVYPYSHEIAWVAKISYDGFCMRKDVKRQEFAWTEKSPR